MSLDTEVVPAADGTSVQGDLLEAAASPLAMSLQDFVAEFGDELLDSLNRANPPVYTGQARPHRQLVLASLKRKLFGAQAEVVHAVTEAQDVAAVGSLPVAFCLNGVQVDGVIVYSPHFSDGCAAVFMPAGEALAVEKQFPSFRFFLVGKGIVCRRSHSSSFGGFVVAGANYKKAGQKGQKGYRT